MKVRHIMATAALLACGAGAALAADQTILGKAFTVKNPATPDRRKVVVVGKEAGSPNTLVGDPTANGATLTINANGGTPSSQTFVLNQGTSSVAKPFWTAVGTTGFKYRDPKGDQGPVKLAFIKKAPSGTFAIKAIVAGKLDGGTVIVPPDPGTDACAVLSINLGDAYNVSFGSDSIIKNVLNKLFKAKKPSLEAVCGVTTTTTIPTTTSTTGPVTTTTSTSTTTSTTMAGSPSAAFLE